MRFNILINLMKFSSLIRTLWQFSKNTVIELKTRMLGANECIQVITFIFQRRATFYQKFFDHTLLLRTTVKLLGCLCIIRGFKYPAHIIV